MILQIAAVIGETSGDYVHSKWSDGETLSIEIRLCCFFIAFCDRVIYNNDLSVS